MTRRRRRRILAPRMMPQEKHPPHQERTPAAERMNLKNCGRSSALAAADVPQCTRSQRSRRTTPRGSSPSSSQAPARCCSSRSSLPSVSCSNEICEASTILCMHISSSPHPHARRYYAGKTGCCLTLILINYIQILYVASLSLDLLIFHLA